MKSLRLLCLATVFFALIAPVRANQNLRNWTQENGETFTAEIVRVDEKEHTVRLRRDGNEVDVAIDSLSARDRAWILEWVEQEEELSKLVKKLGGRIERFEVHGNQYSTPCYAYHPSGNPPPGTKRPLMLLIDPSGNARRYVLRHMEAAEAAKITIVATEILRNEMKEEDERGAHRELVPLIESAIPHDPARVLLGGTSGGALQSFLISAEFPDHKWLGVYSNGGWLGPGTYNDWPYPAMRVAMVNGDQDEGARQWLKSTSTVLNKRGCTIVLMAFEGGHQIPPTSVQVKAFKWLLGEIE